MDTTKFPELEKGIEKSRGFLSWEDGWGGPGYLKPDEQSLEKAWEILHTLAETTQSDINSFEIGVCSDATVTLKLSNYEDETMTKSLLIQIEPKTQTCVYAYKGLEKELGKQEPGWRTLIDVSEITAAVKANFSVAS